MTITRFIIIILAIYLAYRFIFHFALPLYRTSRRIQKQFREMQDQMNANGRQQTQNYPGGAAVKNSKAQSDEPSKDYIDFEEVK